MRYQFLNWRSGPLIVLLMFLAAGRAHADLRRVDHIDAWVSGGASTLVGATDRNPATSWNSGGHGPAWIMFDLGRPVAISQIRMQVSQSPSGLTSHRVWAGPTLSEMSLVKSFDVSTSDGQVL